MIRHAFPMMIDYIVQLFGYKQPTGDDLTLSIQGTLLPGKYPQSQFTGFYKYGYNDDAKNPELYHRFLHREVVST